MTCNSRVSTAIQTLVGVFHEYASKDCHDGKEKDCGGEACMNQFKLSKQELKELVQKELDLDNVRDPAKLDEMMKDLDDDGDGQLDFQEFVVLVVGMACLCNEFVEMLLGAGEEQEQTKE